MLLVSESLRAGNQYVRSVTLTLCNVDIGDNPLDLLTENRPNLIWNFCERGFC